MELARRLGFADKYCPKMLDVTDWRDWDEQIIERIYKPAYEKWAEDENGLLGYYEVEPPSWEEFQKLPIVRVPGAFEMPLACKKLAASGKYDGIVAVGAVIRGGTPHFDFVAAEATKGLAHVSLESGVPVGFGLLTTDNIEQAIERAGTKAGNKGVEAASAVLETVRVLQQI